MRVACAPAMELRAFEGCPAEFDALVPWPAFDHAGARHRTKLTPEAVVRRELRSLLPVGNFCGDDVFELSWLVPSPVQKKVRAWRPWRARPHSAHSPPPPAQIVVCVELATGCSPPTGGVAPSACLTAERCLDARPLCVRRLVRSWLRCSHAERAAVVESMVAECSYSMALLARFLSGDAPTANHPVTPELLLYARAVEWVLEQHA